MSDSSARTPPAALGNLWPEIGLTLLCLLLFFFRLGDAGLFDLDEGVYVSAARTMAVTGNFVTPRLNSRPYYDPSRTLTPFFEKPIMVYWVSAASMRLFGTTELAARLPAAAASLLATLALVWFGRRRFGRRAGLLAGLVYATVPMTILDARQMTTDALLVLWILGVMIGFIEGRPILLWLAGAMAVLTKGPVGLLLPALVMLVFQAVSWYMARRGKAVGPLRPAGRNRLLAHTVGILLLLAITLPWHLAVLRAGGLDANGHTWLGEYIVRQHIGRFKGSDVHHNAPLPTYIVYFLIGFFPWACFVPFAIVSRRRRPELGSASSAADLRATGAAPPNESGAAPSTETESGAAGAPAAVSTAAAAPVGEHREPLMAQSDADALPDGPATALRLFLQCWFWTIFLFFSASAAKLPTYIVPMYPAAALLVGAWLDRQLSAADAGRQVSRGLWRGGLAAAVTALILFAATVAVPYYTRQKPVMQPDAAHLAQLLTGILALGCVVALPLLIRAARGDRRGGVWGIVALAATTSLMFVAIAGPGYGIANRWIFGPYQDLAALARPDAARGIPVIYYDFGDRRPSMLFYARDYSPLERKETPLLPFLQQYAPGARTVEVITLQSSFDTQLKPELDAAGWKWQLLAQRDSGLARWYLLRVTDGAGSKPGP